MIIQLLIFVLYLIIAGILCEKYDNGNVKGVAKNPAQWIALGFGIGSVPLLYLMGFSYV